MNINNAIAIYGSSWLIQKTETDVILHERLGRQYEPTIDAAKDKVLELAHAHILQKQKAEKDLASWQELTRPTLKAQVRRLLTQQTLESAKRIEAKIQAYRDSLRPPEIISKELTQAALDIRLPLNPASPLEGWHAVSFRDPFSPPVVIALKDGFFDVEDDGREIQIKASWHCPDPRFGKVSITQDKDIGLQSTTDNVWVCRSSAKAEEVAFTIRRARDGDLTPEEMLRTIAPLTR